MNNKKLQLDDFLHYKFLSSVQISPENNNYFACIVKKANVEENDYDSNIYLYDLKNNILKQLTTSNDDEAFVWTLSGDALYFRSKRDKKKNEEKKDFELKTEYYVIPIDGGEAKKAFVIPANVKEIDLISKTQLVGTAVFDQTRIDTRTMDEKEKKEYFEQLEDEQDYEVAEEVPFWFNAKGFTNRLRTRLFTFNIETEDFQWLTADNFEVNSYYYDEKTRAVTFTGNEREKKLDRKTHLFFVSLDSDLKNIEIHQLSERKRYFYEPVIFDTKIMVQAKDGIEYGLNENPKFYTYEVETKKSTCITPEFDRSVYNSVNSDCRLGGGNRPKKHNKKLYFVSTDNFNSHLYSLDLHGNIEQLTVENGAISAFDIQNETILIIGERGQKLQEIYMVKDNKEEQKTDFNTTVLQNKAIQPEHHCITQTKAPDLDTWIIKPVGFDPEKKYPTILEIHGGPKTVYGTVFFHEMQVLASMGYCVIFGNPRGSDGRGNEFMDIRGKYGTIDYEDLMKIVDHFVQFDFIDETKLGVTGGSYGGFMTNWIIGQTDRFKAAVSLRSIANTTSFFNESDIGYIFGEDQWDANPWNDNSKLWKQSPVRNADKVDTPTLFIHSAEDWRCPPTEGFQMFSALQYHKVPSRLVLFKGENHELSRSGKPKHRLRRLKEIIQWFEQRLL